MAKKYLKNLKESVLTIFYKFGRWGFIQITEIRDRIKQDEDFLWDSRIRDELADNYGILSHITSAINQLRKDGLPIISASYGKGYTLAGDWNRSDIDEIWDEKFSANERRKSVPQKEKQMDNLLFNQLMEKVTKAQFAGKDVGKVREKLLVVAKKHNLKKKGKEDGE